MLYQGNLSIMLLFGNVEEVKNALQNLIDLCRANDIPVFERNFSLVDTYSADEAFLTGTFGAQTPVGSIDGRQIGTGQMGPMTERLRGLYKDLIARESA